MFNYYTYSHYIAYTFKNKGATYIFLEMFFLSLSCTHVKSSAGFRTQVNVMNAHLSAGPLGKQSGFWVNKNQSGRRPKLSLRGQSLPSLIENYFLLRK